MTTCSRYQFRTAHSKYSSKILLALSSCSRVFRGTSFRLYSIPRDSYLDMPSVWYGRISTLRIIRYPEKWRHNALMSSSASLMPGTRTYLSQNCLPCSSSHRAVSRVCVFGRPVRAICFRGSNCFTSRRMRSARPKSSSTWLFQMPPLVSMQTLMPFSLSS